MKKIFFPVIIFLIINFPFAFSKPIEVVCTNNSVEITIIKLPAKLVKTEGNSYSIMINNNKYIVPDFSSDLQAPLLQIPVAIPAESEIWINSDFSNFRSLGEYYQNKLFSDKQTELSHYAKIEKQGILRGVNVALLTIQPFDTDSSTNNIKIADSIRIIISFSKELQVTQYSISREESVFYDLIINKEHINSLLQTRFSGKDRNNRLLADSNFWYSPQKKYLKLYTERDGIAYVKTEDLIKYDASYNGININYIHLLYKGKPYPFNVVFDENGILDSGEEIYFAGKRPEGDTTWFNVTANRSAFYLYIDSTQMSYQFKFFPFNVNVQSEITEVRIDKHIEEDHIYSVGYDDILNGTETVPGEGWFWDFISAIADTKLTDPWEKREFKLANFITPTDNPTESLEFSFKVQSRVFDKNPLAPNYHRLALMLNRDSVIKDFYLTRRTDSTINFSLSNDKIFAGSSQWGIVNKGAWKKDFTMVQTDDIWFDYLTIQGSIKPFAYKGTANFLVDNVNTDSKIIVPGFSDSLICVIDTSKNYIINLDNIRGTTFRAGAKSYSPAYSSISLNDSLFTDTLSGFHIAVLKPGNKFEVRNFTNLSDNISDYLNSLPSGSIIAIACNSNSDMPQGLKNTLNSLGSTRANEINSGNVWLFSVNKGQNTGVTEKLFVNGFGSFSGFIQHNSGSSFAGVHYLKKGTGYNLIYSDKHSCEKANIENVSQSDLRATNTKADLIVITADSLLSSANAYADYRKRTLGFNTIVTNIEDVYKEFSYGIKTPHAIRRFLKYAYENYQIPLPKYVVLWGNASWDVRNVMPNEKNFDVVPTFGYPVSDVWFTQFNDSNLYCQMIIGRIPCKTDSEGFIYLNKVKEYDTLSYKPWMKTFLYLSGGDNERNRVDWAVYLKSIVSPYIIDSDFCGDTTSVAKVDPTIGGEAESTRIKEKINSGAFWTTFFGHSSPTVFDMDGWHVDRLNNKGKFGILTTLSCNVGAFAEPFDNSRNRDYIMYPDKGFVAACGSSATGVISAEWNAFNFMLIALTEPDINLRRVGDVLYYSKSKMFQKGESAWNIMHFNLLGDPLVRFRVDTVPNLFIQAQDIKIQNLRNETLISEADSVIKISGVVYNAGVCQKGPVDLLILISYQSQIDSIRVHFESVCRFAPFECFLTIKNKPGNHNFTFIVDPDYQTIDPDRSNNVYATSLEVFTQYLLPLEPLAFWDVKQTGHFFRVINPISSSGEFSYKFDIKKSKDTSSVSIRTSKENEITIKENYIDWKPGLRFDDNSGYWFFASSVRKSNNEKSPPLIIPFTAKSLRDETKAEWTQLNTTHFSENHFENLEINGSIDTAEITLTKKVIPYKIIGINGDQKDYERFVEIDYNNKPIITSPNVSQAPVGINMLVVSAIDGSIKERKYYYTWSDDSSSTYFNRYMRDTVTTDDYVLLATCDQSFRMFWETDSTKVGSKDTLKAILHEFGSVLIDSVNKFNSSFVMFGRKGSKQGTIQEDLDTSGGIATVQGEIIFPDSTGKLITPYIGPARKWERFKAIASGLDSNSKITINVFGHNENSFEDTLLITSNSLTFSLSEIPAQIFPKIKIEVKLDRYVNTANPIITGLSCLYVPLPEFAVLQSQTKIQIDSVMRGEKTAIQTTVGNISKRVQSDSTTLDILLNPESVPELFSEPIPPLAVDQSESVVQSLATKNLELVNTVKIVVNPLKNQNELYSFNNYSNFNFSITEDKINPTVKIYVDGKLVQDGDYVAITPEIKIEMYDNSILEVNIKSLSARINGRMQCVTGDSCDFYSNREERPLKATLTFKSDSMDFGQNLITVYAIDGSGNRDTTRVSVYVSKGGYVENLYNFPNPFDNGTTFSFNYKAPQNSGEALIEMFDLMGRPVKTIRHPVTLGKNFIEWNGLDNSNSRLASGVYFYRMSILSDSYVETHYGKIMAN